ACRIVAEVEQGLRQDFPAQSVLVQVDKPPVFARVDGVLMTAEARQARPDERLPIAASVLDDIGVAVVEVEYQVNGGDVQREAFTFTSPNRMLAEAKHTLALAGKVKEG